MLLSSSAVTWLSQLIVDGFPSGKAAGSLKEGSFLKESLPIITLGAVGVLRSEPTLSSSLSPEEDEDKTSGEGFLEAKEAETLLEERLAMWRVWGLFLKWTCLPALGLVLENKFRESGDSSMLFELSWIPGGSVGFLSDLFRIFKLTMVVVRERGEGCNVFNIHTGSLGDTQSYGKQLSIRSSCLTSWDLWSLVA